MIKKEKRKKEKNFLDDVNAKDCQSLIRNSSKNRAFLKTMKAYCIIFIQALRCHMFSILIRKALKITNSNEMEELKRA